MLPTWAVFSLRSASCHVNAAAAISAKRKSYCVSFKLKAIETAEKKSKEVAGREFGVGAKRIREWCSHEGQASSVQ